MKKHSAGSNGLTRIRSLVEFRHQNPAARFVSTLLAFAIAMLLVIGPSAAYGDDTAPTDPTATDTSTPVDTSTTDTSTTDTSTTDASSTDASSTDTSDATVPGTAIAPAPNLTTKTSSKASTSMSALAAVPSALVSDCFGDGGTIFGGFEVDGNTCVDSPVPAPPAIRPTDWDTPFGTKVDDGFEPGDVNGFTGGSSKVGLDPLGWLIDNDANTKSDVKTAWAGSRVYHTVPAGGPGDGHVFTYFAFERHPKDFPGANGDTGYQVEYNQLPNQTTKTGLSVPHRSPGDLLVLVQQSGSTTLNVSTDGAGIYEYKAGHPGAAGCFVADTADGDGSWCPKSPGANFVSAVNAESSFGEAAIDITALFGVGNCSGTFGVINMRSSASTETTSAMQDYILPVNATTPSTCGSLTIQKQGLTGGTLIPGAAYSIVDDPRPGAGAGTHYNVFDGTAAQLSALTGAPSLPADTVPDGNADGKIVVPSVEPGTYTVTELRAPAGYLLPDVRFQTVTVGLAGSDTAARVVTFRDPKKWAPLTATKTAAGHYDIGWSILKQVSEKASPIDADWSSSATVDSSSTSHDFKYRVRVTQLAASNYEVTGAVTVHNTNASSVNATLTEVPGLSDAGGVCAFDSGQVGAGGAITVAPDDNPATQVVEDAGTSYTYTCTFASPPAQGTAATGTNTAHLEWSASAYPQNQGDVDDTEDATRTDRFQANPSDNYSFAPAAGQPTSITVKDVATVGGNPVPHDFTAPELSAGSVDANGDWALTWTPGGGPYTATYTRTITGTAGECTEDGANPNTATIYKTGTSTSLGSSTTNAKLCVGADLLVSKNKTVDMTRTYLWKIDKSTDDTKIVSGQSASYSVTVSRGDGDGYQDSGWTMDGAVTVSNPNDWQSITMSSLVDHYSGDNDYVTGDESTNSCSVTGSRVAGASTWGDVDLSLDAGQVMEYRYHCEFTAKPDYTGTNTATATWDAAAAHTTPDTDSTNSTSSGTAPVADSDWTTAADPVNKTITVTDDHYDDDHGGHVLGTVNWDDVASPYTFPVYSITWTAPAGQCVSRVNTATIEETDQSDSASVLVCNPLTLTGSKTATPEFTRTYNWDVVKQVRTSAQDGEPAGDWQDVTAEWDGPQFSHDFDYRVKVERGTPVDSAYKMSGTITIHNPNMDAGIAPITATVSEPATIGGVAASNCVIDDGNPDTAPNAAQVTLASNTAQAPTGTDVTLPYTCDLAGKPADGTRNSVTVAWGEGAGESTTLQSPAPGVTYDTPTTEVDKSVTAIDDNATLANLLDDRNLGEVTWDQAGTEGFTFPVYTVTHTATTTGCSTANEWTNTVTLHGDDDSFKGSDSATAAICPDAGAWTVSKTSDVGDGPVPTDSDITYTLTAHKTGGVNPTNVVLYDDLSPLAPYADLPTLAELQAAAPAGSTVQFTDNKITWTIDELGSTDFTLDFTIHVKADSYGVDLPNLVTSPGSNCPDADDVTAACDTDNDTPHYTLAKSFVADHDPVMPPYLDNPGTIITYTLTVHNDSDAPVNSDTMSGLDRTVTDNLAGVIPSHATLLGDPTGAGTASVDGTTLTWHLPDLAADDGAPGGADQATLSYRVQVNVDQWDVELRNVATPGNGGDCVSETGCTTTNHTPRYALVQALKVDADTGAPLAGAEFTLTDGEGLNETATSGADGLAKFTTKLQPGTFTVTETKAPAGYDLPEETSKTVTVTDTDLDYGTAPVENAAPVEVEFQDPPLGELAISKAHQELSGGTWVPGDGTVNFNDPVKYVITVTATGKKVFHTVAVTDYVPGYGPNAAKSHLGGFTGVIDPTSITCSATFTTCGTNYNATTGLVTWTLGDVGNESGTVEFVVRMPNLPVISPLAAPGVSFAGLMWNQAYVDYTTVVPPEGTASHHLASNEVTDVANATLPPKVIPPKPPQVSPPAVLPNTGGPSSWLLGAGLILLLGGGTLIAADRRRRHRS